VVQRTPNASHGCHSFRFCRPGVWCCHSNVGRENKGDEKSDDRVTNWEPVFPLTPLATALHLPPANTRCQNYESTKPSKLKHRPKNKPCCKRRFSLSPGPRFRRILPIQTSDCVLPTGTEENRWSKLWVPISCSQKRDRNLTPPSGPRLCQNPNPGLVLFLGPCPPKIPGGVLGHGTDPNVDDGFQKETTRWEK